MKRLAWPIRSIFGLVALLSNPSLFAQQSHGLDLSFRDTSCAPCQAIYEYANGGWIRSQPKPDVHSASGAIEELGDRRATALRQILESLHSTRVRPMSPEWKLATFFESCTDTTAINLAGLSPMQPELARIRAIGSRSDLVREIARLHRYRIPVAFALRGQPDQNAGEVVASLGTPDLGLDADDYVSDDSAARAQLHAYSHRVAHLLEMAGVPASSAAARTRDEMALERQLAVHSPMNMGMDMGKTNASMAPKALTTSDLQRQYPGFDWRSYFALVGVPASAYVKAVDGKSLLAAAKALEVGSLESWRDYLGVRYLEQAIAESFGEDNEAALRVAPNRDGACVNEAEVQLGWILGRMYIAQNFSPMARARVDTMLQNIRFVLRDELQHVAWMSAPTRREALRKLDAFTVELGYPDKWPDFSGVEVRVQPFWANALATKAYRTSLELARIGKRPSRDDWWQGYWPQTSDGYFNPDLNEIVIAAGYIQPPMFDAAADDASNYGGMGAVIGHEMTHAFDQTGREYDSAGRLRNWWTASDRRTYDSLASRVATLYDGFLVVDTLHIKGRQTLNENLADIGGLKLAYLALERKLAGKPRQLVGGLTPEQRFFIAYAQSRRGLFGSAYLEDKVRENSHAPDKWRVLGPIMNMPEFAKAFGCAAGDEMVLKDRERVSLW